MNILSNVNVILSKAKWLVIPCFVFSSFAFSSSALIAEKTVLTLDGAKLVAKAAADKAKSENWNVVIVINDASGKLKYFERMDGAQIGSIDVALQKANTAAMYRRPTKVFHERVKAGELPITTLPHMLAFDGALPIKVGNEVIGAIGVSGVKGHQDAEIAQAGIDALLKALK